MNEIGDGFVFKDLFQGHMFLRLEQSWLGDHRLCQRITDVAQEVLDCARDSDFLSNLSGFLGVFV
ncbi:hypothetical protein AN220_12390 [Streptomyces nanshensis]|nr:hypothetical protein AN220_12390 [Streptomyces nanshensis]